MTSEPQTVGPPRPALLAMAEIGEVIAAFNTLVLRHQLGDPYAIGDLARRLEQAAARLRDEPLPTWPEPVRRLLAVDGVRLVELVRSAVVDGQAEDHQPLVDLITNAKLPKRLIP